MKKIGRQGLLIAGIHLFVLLDLAIEFALNGSFLH